MNEPMLHVDRDASHQLERGMRREWLQTNGRGDFASSTVLMCPTRRYHGLLVATPQGHARRHLFLSRYEETLHGEGRSFPLSIARYAGLWAPHGHDALIGFDLAPHPVFRYRIGEAEVRREIRMVRGRRAVLSRYAIEGDSPPLTLELRPLLGYREADRLTFENLHLSPRVERVGPGRVRVRPYPELPPLTLAASLADAVFEADPVWYRSLEYQRDLERGYDGHEDQFSPGRIMVPLVEGRPVVVSASIESADSDPAADWDEAAASRVWPGLDLPAHAGTRDRLLAAAADFVYQADDGRIGVIAGYPWFGEWGRDTFISLPGLLLPAGQVEACGRALEGAVAYLRRGLMPNIFGADTATSAYNSADASLWFAWAVRQYDRAGGPADHVLGRLLPVLEEIAITYRDGTDLGIGTDESGLLHAGGPALNVTWMDAQTSAGPVTPRHGFAVEANALWYALLSYLVELHERKGSAWQADAWRAHQARVGEAFLERFWLSDGPYLADVWRDGRPDRRIRANMVIAAAMEESPLSRARRLDVVRVAEAELLTPRGLRTLGPEDPDYVGRFEGAPEERDAAYHQGTVWPWLLGFYVEATLRAYGPEPDRLAALRRLLDGFGEHLEAAGLGHVSEVFDGDPPHRPGGAIAQAWSVSELLRAYALLEEMGR